LKIVHGVHPPFIATRLRQFYYAYVVILFYYMYVVTSREISKIIFMIYYHQIDDVCNHI